MVPNLQNIYMRSAELLARKATPSIDEAPLERPLEFALEEVQDDEPISKDDIVILFAHHSRLCFLADWL
jgi:hypothetical protein